MENTLLYLPRTKTEALYLTDSTDISIGKKSLTPWKLLHKIERSGSYTRDVDISVEM